MLRRALEKEAAGIPLILDADAILLAKDRVFHGNALLTPHPGELAAYTGVSKDEILADPAPPLLKLAEGKNAVILFKSHVMYVASPDGRLGIIDGMAPVLGMGGSGDLLAGLCAGIAARYRAIANTALPYYSGDITGRRGEEVPRPNESWDSPLEETCTRGSVSGISQSFGWRFSSPLHVCATAAAALLIESAQAPELASRFLDPLELADRAADLAGAAWLPGPPKGVVT
jgi:hypothetical protein